MNSSMAVITMCLSVCLSSTEIQSFMLSFSLSLYQNYVLKLADMGEVREIHPSDGSTHSKAPNPARNWAPPEVSS